MTQRQNFIIQIVVIVVLVIFGILEVKRATDTQIRHSRANNRSRAVQKPNRSYPMQNGESGTGRLKTVNLGRIEVRLCPKNVKKYLDK